MGADFADMLLPQDAPSIWDSPQVAAAALALAGVVLGWAINALGRRSERKSEDRRAERREQVERERMVREVLVDDYVEFLGQIADVKHVWTERALRDDPPPESAEIEAVNRLGRGNFRIAILDGDEETRVLATNLGKVVGKATTEFPVERLRTLAPEVRERHVNAVRKELRDAEKQLIMKLENRFRIAPRTNWSGEYESWEPE